MLIEIEKGDTIAHRDGRSMRVLSIYRPAGVVLRVDAIEDGADSPMRESVFSKDISRIIKKGPKLGTQPDIKIPEGQMVNAKEPVPQEVKEDVASRGNSNTTASALARKNAEGKKHVY